MTRKGHHHLVMLAVVLAFAAFGILFGEKVQTGGGLGWDGQVYARLVRNLTTILANDQLASYYGHRLLPLAIVHTFSRDDVILGFQLMNLAASLISLWAWIRLSGIFSLSLGAIWVGFAGLFLSFQAAKLSHFNPVLIDSFAIATALVMLLLYVEKRVGALAVWTIIASFVWPTAAITGAALVCFSGASGEPLVARRWWWIAAGLAMLLAVAGFAALEVAPVCAAANRLAANFLAEAGTGDGACGAMQALLTSIVSIALIVPAGAMLLGWPRVVRWRNVALATVILILTVAFNIVLTNPDVPGGTGAQLLARFVLLPQGGKFFLPLVSIAVFWGPLAIIAALYWGSVTRSAWHLGPGMAFAVALTLPLMLVTEPRFITFQWPFLTLCTVLAVERRLNGRFLAGFAATAILFSKFWLPINYAAWVGADDAGIDQFPKQMYFMNLGFWMTWWPFVVQTAVVIAVAFLMRGALSRADRRGSPS